MASHGYASHRNPRPEYWAWQKIIQRCTQPHRREYKNYGARGITVCDRWLESFENFIQDMGDRPSPRHSIDRINNDGPYAADNCRWATWREQNNNRRANHVLEVNGIRQTMTQWSEQTGIKVSTIYERLRRQWPVARAVGHPLISGRPRACRGADYEYKRL